MLRKISMKTCIFYYQSPARPGTKHKITHICAGSPGFAAELNSFMGKKQNEN